METALKKLRRKFVAVIMVIVFAVLAVAFTTVCVISYNQETAAVYDALEASVLRVNSDELDTGNFAAGATEEIEQSDAHGKNEGRQNGRTNKAQGRFEIGERDNGTFIPVVTFRVEKSGAFELVSDPELGEMSSSAARQAIEAVKDVPAGRGLLQDPAVFYCKTVQGGVTYVSFADEGSASGWKSLAVRLVGVGLCALAVFFVLALLFSAWALRPVRESWNKQQQFVADASHELKTPLTVLAADVSILSRNPEKTVASQSQWVESMEAEISSMQELVGDMLTLARADAGAEAADEPLALVNLSKLVEAQLLQFESLAYERAIDMESTITDGLTVQGNSERLRRMVGTLLDNAYKYAGDGGTVRVNLDAEVAASGAAAAKGICLRVANSGDVIPAADLPHVFDRFYRADKARTREASGSFGLGLAIAKETAESMGATMSVASDEEHGTVFTVVFP